MVVSGITAALFGVLAAQSASAQRAPVIPSADRELMQLHDAVRRAERIREIERLEESKEVRELKGASESSSAERKPVLLKLTAVEHSPSAVLTEQEIDEAVAPYIGSEVGLSDVRAMLEAINALYRAKGFAVCQARLLPQRIKDGRIFVTLVEGRTGTVSVSGNESTSPQFIRSALNLREGEVDNTRELTERLVWFNMTNDAQLRVDMRAGKQPQTTDYVVDVNEPSRWTATVFADSSGTESTGRERAGAAITNRSVFGRRDAFTLMGLASRGSKNVLASYALPLNARGTRLSFSASLGDMEVVEGVSKDMDVYGRSALWSVRLEQPVEVRADRKVSVYAQYEGRSSETEFLGFTANKTRIDSFGVGFEAVVLSERYVFYGTVGVDRASVREDVFGTNWQNNLLVGSAFWRVQAAPAVSLVLAGAWQLKLGGDPLSTSQYFYLGGTSGVRGYDNDVLSAQAGGRLSAEVRVKLPYDTETYAFVDAGRLTGESAYERRSIASSGLGFQWKWSDRLTLGATAAWPLMRELDAGTDVDRVRFDFSAVMFW